MDNTIVKVKRGRRTKKEIQASLQEKMHTENTIELTIETDNHNNHCENAMVQN